MAAFPEVGAAPRDPDRRLAVLRPPPRRRGEQKERVGKVKKVL